MTTTGTATPEPTEPLHRRTATTPGSVADALAAALAAQGGVVAVRVADGNWATGFVIVDMPDGTAVRIDIRLD